MESTIEELSLKGPAVQEHEMLKEAMGLAAAPVQQGGHQKQFAEWNSQMMTSIGIQYH